MPSTDFLSQDPTTWSDFTDPAAHGFTKVDCDTSLETGHRVVLVNANGHVLPLSNWRREDLWSCNNEASDLAKKLECETHEAPEESRLVISVENGRTTATFAPFPWWSRGGNYYLLALMLLVYVGLALVRLGRH